MGPVLGQHPFLWLLSAFLGIVWLSRVLAAGLNMHKVADITRAEFDAAPVEADGSVPRVSIVVPACDEAEHIEAALRSLLRLDYPDYEVIAIDDRSTDATGAIMDRLCDEWHRQPQSDSHRLHVLHITTLPDGWLGKTHAMWNAAQQTTGKWLLFTDADVIFRSDALRRAIVYAERELADHLVVFPTMVMKTPGERMMMAFFQSQFVFAHRPWKVADPKSRDHMGVGAFNLIRREVYESIGTYRRLRLSVLDDMKLGELVKQHGYRQRNVFGRNLLTLRWVVGALGMIRNLTKNFFAILRYSPAWAITAIAGMLLVNLGPFVGWYFAQGWTRAGFVVALFSILAIYVGMSRHSQISPAYFILHPVGALLFGYAVAHSMVLTLARGGVVWRDTLYPLKELKRFSRENSHWSWL
jgi:glycosyltransferase involved in cell wall biosynthesis